DQGDDVDLGLGVLGDLSQQRTLADAAPGEDADALPPATGQQAIDGTLAGDEDIADAISLQRRRRLRPDRAGLATLKQAAAIQWPPPPIEEAPEQARAYRHGRPPADANDLHPRMNLARLVENHVGKLIGKADNLSLESAALGGNDLATIAHSRRQGTG